MGKRKTETFLVVPTVATAGDPVRRRLVRGTQAEVERHLLKDFHIVPATLDDANALGREGVAIEESQTVDHQPV